MASGLIGARRRDVVVVAAVLVVGDEERGAAPLRRVQDGRRHAGQEALAELDVLRVLLRDRLVVGVDEAELRQPPRGRVVDEVLHALDEVRRARRAAGRPGMTSGAGRLS